MLALLVQENVREGLLDVLEVENYAVALNQHLVDQVSLGTDHVLLELLRQVWVKVILAT